jgi:peptidoglycan/LPS O-acetylase OafA/YrhL
MRPPVAAGKPSAKHTSLYIPSLDGIRACSVIVVFAAHAGLRGIIPGDFGVTVFFFLSGYLITTLLRMEHEQTGAISFRAFYLRRVLRIFPPFYLVLIAATLLTAVGGLPAPNLQLRPDALLAQALYLTNYYVIQNGWWTGHAPGTWIFWSLCIEEHFYLVFPLLYVLLLRLTPSRRRHALVLAGLCAVVLAWRLVLVFALHATHDRTYMATDTRIDSILFGCILGVFANPLLDKTRVSADRWRFVWFPLGLAGLLVSFVIRTPSFQQAMAYSLQGLCLFPLFIAAIRYHDWELFQLLNLRWVKFVGVLSYSIYLLHPEVLWGIGWWVPVPGVVQAGLGLALTLAIAYAIYRLVEQPATRLRRRLSRVLVPAAAAAVRPVSTAAPAQAQAIRP